MALNKNLPTPLWLAALAGVGALIIGVAVMNQLDSSGRLYSDEASQGQPQQDTKQENTATKEKAKITKFDEERFSFEAPEGWIRKNFLRNSGADEKYEYVSGDGRYYLTIELNFEDLGHGYSVDATWQIKTNSTRDGISDVTIGTPCVKEPEDPGFCTSGDGKYDAYAGPNPEFKTNYYDFFFGDTKQESGVDAGVFENIFKSFKVK